MNYQVGAELISQLEGMLGVEFQNHNGMTIALAPDKIVTFCEFGKVMQWGSDVYYFLFDKEGKAVVSADLFPAIQKVAGLPDHAQEVMIIIDPDGIVQVEVTYPLPTGSLDILEGYSLKRIK